MQDAKDRRRRKAKLALAIAVLIMGMVGEGLWIYHEQALYDALAHFPN